MTRRILNSIENTISVVPPMTIEETENSFLILALLAVLMPTIRMIIEGKRMIPSPKRSLSSNREEKVNSM